MRKGFWVKVSLCIFICFILAGCSAAAAGEGSSGKAGDGSSAKAGNGSSANGDAGSSHVTAGVSSDGEAEQEAPEKPEEESTQETADTQLKNEESEDNEMQMKIGDTVVAVEWEKNESVKALEALCENGPLTIQMSMYGGFEQVGSIGKSLPRSDRQTKTQTGDIVLYSGDQLVVFYGSNEWSYTRLGHISDKSAQEMTDLLSNGDVTITIE